ncbi:DgyrCDS14917 [Dimorphilus gyrociliatus]|uniref:DgyrCDS14917 n=1 Tax=Dimorphilus gyrociliatus TaxID=2664684 RepID=A0A7I8WFC1_9ANNE|nr:DgyrCDS14917 [Dimorphilus gyrociliatus]
MEIYTILLLFLCFNIKIQISSTTNLASGKFCFQSSTRRETVPKKPHFATNFNNGIVIGDGTDYCSVTDADPLDVSWWSVDLEKVYSVTKVCILSVDDSSYENLKDFNIFVGNFPKDHQTICKYVTGPVKRPISTDISQYNCYSCNTGSIGSFVTIQLTRNNVVLILCDVEIYGDLIKKDRDFHQLDMSNVKEIHGGIGENQPPRGGFDNNFRTIFHSRNHIMVYNPNHQFCVQNFNGTFRTVYELINIQCNPTLEGRYVLIIQNDSPPRDRFLEFSEVNLYVSLLDEHELQTFNGPTYKSGILVKVKNYLHNNVSEKVTSGNFLFSHTVCLEFEFMLTKEIQLISQDNIGISEVDIFAVSKISHKGL